MSRLFGALQSDKNVVKMLGLFDKLQEIMMVGFDRVHLKNILFKIV